MKHRSHLIGLAVAAALAAAPRIGAAQTAFAHLEGRQAEEQTTQATQVEVRNQNYLDVNVYVWSGTQRLRLGSVSGLSTRSLTIPTHLVFGITSLRFELDPVGSRGRPVTNEVSVVQGDEVVLTVPPFRI